MRGAGGENADFWRVLAARGMQLEQRPAFVGDLAIQPITKTWEKPLRPFSAGSNSVRKMSSERTCAQTRPEVSWMPLRTTAIGAMSSMRSGSACSASSRAALGFDSRRRSRQLVIGASICLIRGVYVT